MSERISPPHSRDASRICRCHCPRRCAKCGNLWPSAGWTAWTPASDRTCRRLCPGMRLAAIGPQEDFAARRRADSGRAAASATARSGIRSAGERAACYKALENERLASMADVARVYGDVLSGAYLRYRERDRTTQPDRQRQLRAKRAGGQRRPARLEPVGRPILHLIGRGGDRRRSGRGLRRRHGPKSAAHGPHGRHFADGWKPGRAHDID